MDSDPPDLPTELLPTILLALYTSCMTKELRKAGANWVDGDRFFDRETELMALTERIRDGTHTLLTAQRRMGKTSLVRELLRRLNDEGDVATVFIDLEGANDAADAVAEIAIQAKSVQKAWVRIRSDFANRLRDVRDHVEEVGIADLRVKLRAGIDAGSWQRSGDQIFEALAANENPVVLAIDELPILVNRMLKGQDYRLTPERREAADQFLSWLRRNGQAHRGKVCIVISGSIGLEPVLRQAGLSAQANIFSSFELQPWSQDISVRCLDALARTYGIEISMDLRREMCRRLRCCVPHHVQQFFDHLHEHLRRDARNEATTGDVEQVYERDLLGVRGQIDLEHYEGRLRMVLGPEGYRTALTLLTEAAVNGGLLMDQAVQLYRESSLSSPAKDEISIDDVLYSLEHDGYLERHAGDYRFVSGLLEDWWRARHGQFFTSIVDR